MLKLFALYHNAQGIDKFLCIWRILRFFSLTVGWQVNDVIRQKECVRNVDISKSMICWHVLFMSFRLIHKRERESKSLEEK